MAKFIYLMLLKEKELNCTPNTLCFPRKPSKSAPLRVLISIAEESSLSVHRIQVVPAHGGFGGSSLLESKISPTPLNTFLELKGFLLPSP